MTNAREWAGRERRAVELDRKIAAIFRAVDDRALSPAARALRDFAVREGSTAFKRKPLRPG
jgi:hypothetical protein